MTSRGFRHIPRGPPAPIRQGSGLAAKRPGILCVPKTSSTSCDQAIFVDHATDAGFFPYAVPVEIDRIG
jgi:hypothetical protein